LADHDDKPAYDHTDAPSPLALAFSGGEVEPLPKSADLLGAHFHATGKEMRSGDGACRFRLLRCHTTEDRGRGRPPTGSRVGVLSASSLDCLVLPSTSRLCIRRFENSDVQTDDERTIGKDRMFLHQTTSWAHRVEDNEPHLFDASAARVKLAPSNVSVSAPENLVLFAQPRSKFAQRVAPVITANNLARQLSQQSRRESGSEVFAVLLACRRARCVALLRRRAARLRSNRGYIW
jgi:hypothetical protein